MVGICHAMPMLMPRVCIPYPPPPPPLLHHCFLRNSRMCRRERTCPSTTIISSRVWSSCICGRTNAASARKQPRSVRQPLKKISRCRSGSMRRYVGPGRPLLTCRYLSLLSVTCLHLSQRLGEEVCRCWSTVTSRYLSWRAETNRYFPLLVGICRTAR